MIKYKILSIMKIFYSLIIYSSYVDISHFVELHVSEKSNKNVTKTNLKCGQIGISSVKSNLSRIYHKIKRKYRQLYLNEFVFKLHRRYYGDKLFDRLIIVYITGL